MAQRGPFDPPKWLKTACGKFHFDRFWANSTPRFASSLALAPGHNPGERTTNGPNRQNRRPGGSHDPQEAFFRAPMAPGRIARWWNPFARDQGAAWTPGWFWAILGHPGPLPACRGPIRAVRSSRTAADRHRRVFRAPNFACSMALHGVNFYPATGPLCAAVP